MAESRLITDKINKKSSFIDMTLTRLSRQLVFAFFNRIRHGQVKVVETVRNSEHKEFLFGNNNEFEATIFIHDTRFYSRLILGGSIGAGESYIEGWWDSPDVTKVIEFFSINLDLINDIEDKLNWLKKPLQPIINLLNTNTRKKAKKNIVAHYDLGNELYSRFLDPTMLYSSAIYPSEQSTLHEASLNKLKVICDNLQLKPGEHLLEIGTGWGALAIYAAKHYDCYVTTTTISEEQYRYVSDLVEASGLTSKITLLKSDYRDLTGKFDKLVSVEMIEAVGHRYFDEYFSICAERLNPGGRMLIQSILIEDERYDSYKNSTDFIQKYIFPGGALPSKQVVYESVKNNTTLLPIDFQAFGHDYAKTLNAWRVSFNNNWQKIKPFGYDDKFKRLWNFYFHYCEGGFLQNKIDVAHFVFKKTTNA
ncbi:SAM-dependent methyltransferase [Pleionea mediterranea]|uniref:Cyclopropane-fatty-acyl-phospholipid synthase n=1 Tax=Pleionea mediterranea TaxID=523701 RepID=A0A316G6E9_9GAMM|nr:cyclopropane-fatty-acyl-phospholipid synthase family protein [Pleionea mediterranea]PWK50017.1 cyclopropane-fatty-acyl-phospholipid synthase [Pleionea mediterranea]